jgi:putative nucleotidyltransferase with HDIG domain
MNTPTKEEAQKILFEHVTDPYQRHHALMVGTAMEGYAKQLGEDELLWFITGYLHDVDYEQFPEEHPGESLKWFKEWGYASDLIHAVEAHAFGYNGFNTEPESKLAACLMACDEISGIFYAYQKLNPVPYGEMKGKSIRKRLKDKAFAAKIERDIVYMGCEKFGVSIEDHVDNLIQFFAPLNISKIG